MHMWEMTFLEGVISFVSPCMLPMLPVYVAYFSADGTGKGGVLLRSLAFMCGFSVVFVCLGAFAGTVGAALAAHRAVVNTVCGAIVAVFGLGYLGVFKLPFTGMKSGYVPSGAGSAFVFGLIYSVCLTPCVGAFLGAALMQAAAGGDALKGALLLLTYSCGLGVPFVVSAVLLDRFKSLFGFVKSRYAIINPLCGALLILFGAWMAASPWMKAYAAGRNAGHAEAAPAGESGCCNAGACTDSDGIAPNGVKDKKESEKKMEIQLTQANFESEVLKSDVPVLVDFWAPWCGPCRMLAPVVETLAKNKAGALKVGKVNVDEEPLLAAKYGINSIPAIFVFKNGKIVSKGVGYMNYEALEKLVQIP